MTVRFPENHDIPALKRLWKVAFGDPEGFIDDFFAIAFSPDRCRGIWDGENPAAVLYWFDGAYLGQKFAYLYAVATDPSYRNRGLCWKLMEDTAGLLTRAGYDGLVLCPAGEGLRRMYGSMGYVPCTDVTEFSVDIPGEPASMERIGQGAYTRLRWELLPEGGLVQEGVLLDFLASQAEFFRGEDWLAVGYCQKDTFFCQELLGDASSAPGILGALGMQKGKFRTPGTGRPLAMGRKLKDSCVLPTYLGLPLD